MQKLRASRDIARSIAGYILLDIIRRRRRRRGGRESLLKQLSRSQFVANDMEIP